jgi:hypothetical protein
MKYKSQFHQHVHSTLTGVQYDELIGKFSSPKRFFYVMKKPNEASHRELIVLSGSLGVDTVQLMDEHKVATFTLSPSEKDMHVRLRVLTQKVNDLSALATV